MIRWFLSSYTLCPLLCFPSVLAAKFHIYLWIYFSWVCFTELFNCLCKTSKICIFSFKIVFVYVLLEKKNHKEIIFRMHKFIAATISALDVRAIFLHGVGYNIWHPLTTPHDKKTDSTFCEFPYIVFTILYFYESQ